MLSSNGRWRSIPLRWVLSCIHTTLTHTHLPSKYTYIYTHTHTHLLHLRQNSLLLIVLLPYLFKLLLLVYCQAALTHTQTNTHTHTTITILLLKIFVPYHTNTWLFEHTHTQRTQALSWKVVDRQEEERRGWVSGSHIPSTPQTLYIPIFIHSIIVINFQVRVNERMWVGEEGDPPWDLPLCLTHTAYLNNHQYKSP